MANKETTKQISPLALNNISYGLYVLSVKDGDKDNACIINTFTQVNNTNPTLFTISIGKHCYTHDMLKKTKVFNISVITKDANFVFFKRFGFTSGRDKNKFSECKNIYRSSNGLIYIKRECNAYMSLEVTTSVDLDTHTLFTAKLVESVVLSDTPSVTYADYHKHIKPKANANSTNYRCTICNFILEAPQLPKDYVCPICNQGADAFVKT